MSEENLTDQIADFIKLKKAVYALVRSGVEIEVSSMLTDDEQLAEFIKPKIVEYLKAHVTHALFQIVEDEKVQLVSRNRETLGELSDMLRRL